ncbi:RNA chaperone Hfq [Halarsenatibacter silvermanii]|uniref:RNA chaperone Hfq n=1 Tax=Halarsenatibacter silvermanii TaxID=321763 RepID=A0A1G9NZ89_9FIRM|nr:RNA chaperone Hfq [Halarsenatibacter silvermanii]SDL91623.1 RNA chaperone Hfq [Halarsenatibacter silvermanii]
MSPKAAYQDKMLAEASASETDLDRFKILSHQRFFTGCVAGFDQFTMVLKGDKGEKQLVLVYKHAISTIAADDSLLENNKEEVND